MRVLRALAVVSGIGRALHDVQRPPAARLTSAPNCRVQALKSQAPACSSSAAPGPCSVVAAPAARWRAAVAAQEASVAAEVSGSEHAASVVSRAPEAAPAVWPVSPAGGSGRAPLMRGREPYSRRSGNCPVAPALWRRRAGSSRLNAQDVPRSATSMSSQVSPGSMARREEDPVRAAAPPHRVALVFARWVSGWRLSRSRWQKRRP